MMQKLHLFSTKEQPQLHDLVGELELKLIDLLDTKKVKTNEYREFLKMS